MHNDQRRYFIELQSESAAVPRSRETALRREQATLFVASLHEWLKSQDLDGKVSHMAITALGQVQITCEAELIGLIHSQEEVNIATIRHGATYVEGLSRWGKQ